MKSIVAIAILSISFAACKSVKKSVLDQSRNNRLDSVHVKERVKFDTLHAASESVVFSIPVSKLDSVPIEKRQGRASVQASVKEGILYLRANCDSLQKIIASMDREVFKLQFENEFIKKEMDKSVTRIPWWTYLLIGMSPFTLLGIVYCFFKFIKP